MSLARHARVQANQAEAFLTNVAAGTGASWARYAPGDHTR